MTRADGMIEVLTAPLKCYGYSSRCKCTRCSLMVSLWSVTHCTGMYQNIFVNHFRNTGSRRVIIGYKFLSRRRFDHQALQGYRTFHDLLMASPLVVNLSEAPPTLPGVMSCENMLLETEFNLTKRHRGHLLSIIKERSRSTSPRYDP